MTNQNPMVADLSGKVKRLEVRAKVIEAQRDGFLQQITELQTERQRLVMEIENLKAENVAIKEKLDPPVAPDPDPDQSDG